MRTIKWWFVTSCTAFALCLLLGTIDIMQNGFMWPLLYLAAALQIIPILRELK